MLKSQNPKRTIRLDPHKTPAPRETSYVIDEGIYHCAATFSDEAIDLFPERVLEELELRLDRFIASQRSTTAQMYPKVIELRGKLSPVSL